MDLTVVQEALESADLFDDDRLIFEEFDPHAGRGVFEEYNDYLLELFNTLQPSKEGYIEAGVLLELMHNLDHHYTMDEVHFWACEQIIFYSVLFAGSGGASKRSDRYECIPLHHDRDVHASPQQALHWVRRSL